MPHTFRSSFRTALVLLALASGSFAAKISADLQTADADSALDVIIQYRHPLTARHHAAIARYGGQLKAPLHAIRAAAYHIPARSLEALRHNPEIAYISPDRPLQPMLEYAEPTVNANIALQYGYNGAGIGIALLDSGISNHPDLKSGGALRVAYNWSAVSGGTDDHYGHGNHVAGILAGNGSQSTGPQYIHTFMGIAPAATLINLRVLDQNGSGSDSGVIAAIQQAIALKNKYNIRVINLSLGRPVYESYTIDPLCQAVEAAWKAGIVVVVAAGNDGRDNSFNTNGYGTITAPGNDPYVITVGAMKDEGTVVRTDDLIASYSSKGPTMVDHIAKPDLVAPGNLIISLLASTASMQQANPQVLVPMSYYQQNGGAGPSNQYMRLSGTSMAAPMVSGAAALLLQQNPSLTPDQVKARLMKTASKTFPVSSIATDPNSGMTYTSYYDLFTVGAGYLDVWAALNSTDVAAGTALSPVAVSNVLTGGVSLAFNPTDVWGVNICWGTNVVWGTTNMSGTTVLSGTNIIWGTGGLLGFNILWGTNTVWGTTSSILDMSSIEIMGEQ